MPAALLSEAGKGEFLPIQALRTGFCLGIPQGKQVHKKTERSGYPSR